MLAIARGLMARPEVLMLDEPSLGLAPKLLEVLYDLLAELREEGTTILLVDQMATLALSVADRAYVLQSGTIKHSGSAREVARGPGADARLSRRSRDRTVTEAQPREERPPWTSFSGTRGASAPSTN